MSNKSISFFFFQAEDGIRDPLVTGVQTCALPIWLPDLIAAKGMKTFAVIDQAAEARKAGQQLRDTTLVIFGSPAAGTPVMAASPLAALDLPLKVLVWADDGQTNVTYYAPGAL